MMQLAAERLTPPLWLLSPVKLSGSPRSLQVSTTPVIPGPRRQRTGHSLHSSASSSLGSATAAGGSLTIPSEKSGRKWDLVLSSGFLSFASHAGFLQAVQEAGLEVGGIMGTSAGALAGSLYCAGFDAEQVASELSRVPPSQLLVPCKQPWQGILSLERVVDRLRVLLPPTFEDLPQEFAVGVVGRRGQHLLINSGPLPEAVAASAAIPVIFGPVSIPGRMQGPFQDGGVADRIGLDIWTGHRRRIGSSSGTANPPALVHLIARSSPFSGTELIQVNADVVVVRAPKSGASFWNLGNFSQQMEAARARTALILEQLAAADTALS